MATDMAADMATEVTHPGPHKLASCAVQHKSEEHLCDEGGVFGRNRRAFSSDKAGLRQHRGPKILNIQKSDRAARSAPRRKRPAKNTRRKVSESILPLIH